MASADKSHLESRKTNQYRDGLPTGAAGGPSIISNHPKVDAFDALRASSAKSVKTTSDSTFKSSPFSFNVSGGGSTLGALASGALGYYGARQRNIASAQQAQKMMDFQERMSSTAHQRQMADMRKAGLNPILSAKYGGASTPGGAQAPQFDKMAAALSNANAAAQLDQQIQQIKGTKIQNQIIAASLPFANMTADFWSHPTNQKKFTFDQYVNSALALSQIVGNLFNRGAPLIRSQ